MCNFLSTKYAVRRFFDGIVNYKLISGKNQSILSALCIFTGMLLSLLVRNSQHNRRGSRTNFLCVKQVTEWLIQFPSAH